MNKSTKFLLASVSPVALAAGWAVLDSAPAHATITVTSTIITYAIENFIGASASSSIVLGATAFTLTSGATSSDFGVGQITFTLSNGATFAAAPSPTGSTNLTLGTGSLVSSSTAVTYAVTSVGSTTAATITLGNFQVSAIGTRLATSNQNITLTYGSTVGSNIPATASATIAVGAQAYSFTAGAAANPSIDLANGGAGLTFRAASGLSNVTFATLSTLSQGAAVVSNDISGATLFTNGASDTVRAFITGNLSAFSSVYAATAACAATAPTGALSGTLTTTSATFSPLVIGSVYNICVIANGTTIIPSGTITGSASVSFAARTVSSITYTPGAFAQAASTLATIAYNGSTATAFYVVGLGSYTSAIRVTNTSVSSGSVFVSVTPDTTGTPVRALLDSTLAAGQSKFYLASDIRTAVGTSVLTDSNDRASVVFLSAFTGMRVQNFIVNPGGALSGGTSNDGTVASGN